VCFAAHLHLYAAHAHRRKLFKNLLLHHQANPKTRCTCRLQRCTIVFSMLQCKTALLRMLGYFVQKIKMSNALRFTVGGRCSLVAGAA
jgi:hypothetical protein